MEHFKVSEIFDLNVLVSQILTKNAQIWESDFGKPQNWGNFPFLTLATSNFLGLFVIKFDSKSSWMKVKSCYMRIYPKKKRDWGKNASFV